MKYIQKNKTMRGGSIYVVTGETELESLKAFVQQNSSFRYGDYYGFKMQIMGNVYDCMMNIEEDSLYFLTNNANRQAMIDEYQKYTVLYKKINEINKDIEKKIRLLKIHKK